MTSIGHHYETAADVCKSVGHRAFLTDDGAINASIALCEFGPKIFFPSSTAVEAFIAELEALRNDMRALEMERATVAI